MSRTKGAKDKQPRKKQDSNAQPKKQIAKQYKNQAQPAKKQNNSKKNNDAKPKNKVVIARKPSNGKSGFTVKRVESV